MTHERPSEGIESHFTFHSLKMVELDWCPLKFQCRRTSSNSVMLYSKGGRGNSVSKEMFTNVCAHGSGLPGDAAPQAEDTGPAVRAT